MPLISLTALWSIPLIGFIVARRIARPHRGLITGTLLGAIVSPASMGVYSLYYVGPIAAIFGMAGLAMVLFHSVPGFQIARACGLLESKTVIEGFTDHLIIDGINAAVWATLYGLLGAAIDWYRTKPGVGEE